MKAADEVPGPDLAQRRVLVAAAVAVREGTPGPEAAARRRVDQVRRPPGDRGQPPLAYPLALELGERAVQGLRVRVLGVVEELERLRMLDDLPRVHDRDLVGDLG